MALPPNTFRKGGIALLGLAMALPTLLSTLGVGECTPEAVKEGCMSGGEIAASLSGLAGAAVYWIGRNRAEKRESGTGPKT